MLAPDSSLGRLREARARPASPGPSNFSTDGLSMVAGGSVRAVPPQDSTLPPGPVDHPDDEILLELDEAGWASSISPATLFLEEESRLRPLPEEHPIWPARWSLDPNRHPLWGLEHGGRIVAIYSPGDLSCYWNQTEHSPGHPSVGNALKIGQNVVEYATAGKMPPDKLRFP